MDLSLWIHDIFLQQSPQTPNKKLQEVANRKKAGRNKHPYLFLLLKPKQDEVNNSATLSFFFGTQLMQGRKNTLSTVSINPFTFFRHREGGLFKHVTALLQFQHKRRGICSVLPISSTALGNLWMLEQNTFQFTSIPSVEEQTENLYFLFPSVIKDSKTSFYKCNKSSDIFQHQKSS